MQLMLRFKDGDLRAFQSLFEKYSPSLICFVFQFVGSRARAEEIAQDVFLQVYRWQKRYEPTARFSTWLFKIAKNHCLNEMRRGEYRVSLNSMNPLPNEEEEAQDWQIADANAEKGEDLLAAKEVADKIKTTLARLPQNQRMALVLSRMEGLSYEEIAKVLGCSQKAVKSLIFRATQNLRESLKDFLKP